MHRGTVKNAEDSKPTKQGWAAPGDAEPTEINHEPEDACETATLTMVEPGAVDFDHPRRSEGLHVAVNATNSDEQAKNADVGSRAKNHVHGYGSGSANEHDQFPA